MMDLASAQTLISSADPAVFKLDSETSTSDRQMLLAVQNIVRRNVDKYVYVETGSYMGGTLVPHLLDERCSMVISIDPRPDLQPDERSVTFDYTRSSTKLMVERLETEIPLSSMLKLHTFDYDASTLPPEAKSTDADLCFIDGEHTNRAAFSDFMSLYSFTKKDCVFVFHDANLVIDAIANVQAFLAYEGVRFEAMVLPNVLSAIFIGKYATLAAPLKRHAGNMEEFYRASKESLWKEIANSRAQQG